MTLWQYLKKHIVNYGKKIAFANTNITYDDILNFEPTKLRKKYLQLCLDDTKLGQALKILKCIASNNVVVPLTKEYGVKNCIDVQKEIDCYDELDIDNLAMIMFTSGTSGKPKGVMLSNENIISNLQYIDSYFVVENMKTICIYRPLTHISAVVGELLFALCKGLTIYFYEEMFIPQRMLVYFVNNSIDIFCATPTLFKLLAKYNKFQQCKLKVCVVSGERLTEDASKQISESFPNVSFYNVYGLTEHSPRVSALTPSDFTNKRGSVGRAIGDVKIKIIDNELLVKSKSVMLGYYRDIEKTKQKIQQGWLHTGDKAHLDDDGYIYIDGRIDSMLIRAGINFYPEDIEEIVLQIEGVVNCLIYEKKVEDENIVCMKYEGDIDENSLRKRLNKILNPNIVPKKIMKVERIVMLPSGKMERK